MPLNDSFKAKGGPAKVAVLSAVPTADDLLFSLNNARRAPRKSVYLAWHVGELKRLLAVTCGMDPSTTDARWLFRDGNEFDSPIIWTLDSADPAVIHTLVSDSVNQVGPAASIPEFLRPAKTDSDENREPGRDPGRDPSQTEKSSNGSQPQQNRTGVASDKDYSTEAPGSVFADRYEILSEVGKGATSTVYRARQSQIGRVVALKLMHPHLLKDEANKRRFEAEAKATAALSHINLVLVQDYGMSPLGRPFIVMDFIDGPSLDIIVSEQGRLTSQQFIDVFTQCCRGLAHAHKRGVIHRDIKPSNVRLYRDEHDVITAKILDFGIAKLFTQDEESLKMTETGAVMGSPAFMSPEQSRAQSVDHRTDIYSLGVVMFHAATGVLPFKGKDVFETLYKHIYEPVPTFASLKLPYRIPEAVEAIITKTLAKEPDHRYQSMDDLLHDLMKLNTTRLPNTAQPQSSVPLEESAQPPNSVSLEESAQLPSSVPSSVPFEESAQPPNRVESPNWVHMPQSYPFANSTPPPIPVQQNQVQPPYPVPPSNQVQPPYPVQTSNHAQNSNTTTYGPLDLLKQAKIVTDADVQNAIEITSRLGGVPSAMLIADGKLDRSLLEVAKRCAQLVNAAVIDVGRAVILLNYSQRSRLDFDQAAEELGWNLS